MAAPEATSANVNVSISTTISAVIAEIDSIITNKQDQEYAAEKTF